MKEGSIHISLDIWYPVHIQLMLVELNKANSYRSKEIIYLLKNLHLLEFNKKTELDVLPEH